MAYTMLPYFGYIHSLLINMNSPVLKSLKLAGLIGLLTSLSFGAPITGSIGFTGPYTANNTNLTLATELSFDNTLDSENNVRVSGNHTGSFSGIATGSNVIMFTPLQVNGAGDAVVLPGGPIWSVGGFSLTLTSIWEEFNNAGTLNIKGYGTFSDGDVENNSFGEWIATFNTSSDNFTFSASSSAVPDGGTTAILLGFGFLAIGALARRKGKA